MVVLASLDYKRLKMLVGYARTSTISQQAGFEAQIRDLEQAGVSKIFSETLSSIKDVRAELERALDFAREGDTFVVTKIDRLARSTKNLLNIAERLNEKDVALQILDIGFSTDTPSGRLMLTMFGAVAQFERELMLERQREGIAKAKAAGVYARNWKTENCMEPLKCYLDKDYSKDKICELLGVSRATYYRLLKKLKDEEALAC